MIKKGLIRDMRPYREFLKNLAKYQNPGEDLHIFEIGTRRGVSTRAFLEGLIERNEINTEDNSLLTSIDIDDRSNSIRIPELKKKWEFIQADSTGDRVIDSPIDILFIDGYHHSPVPENDYYKYEPLVKENGLIIFHDALHFRYKIKEFIESEIKYPHIYFNHNTEGLCIISKIVDREDSPIDKYGLTYKELSSLSVGEVK